MTCITSIIAFVTFATSASALTFGGKKVQSAGSAFTLDTIPGVLAPVGLFDPLGLGAKANEATLKRYREAELTHGRVAMLASVGFLVGEQVEGTSFLWDASVTGPAITHLSQVPPLFWILLVTSIGISELTRAEIGWVDPAEGKFDQPGKLRDEYIPGNLGFDPMGLRPVDPAEFEELQNKELQNGRLAMLAAAGFMAQELVDGKGIVEHWQATYN